jgi:hypothetical protein
VVVLHAMALVDHKMLPLNPAQDALVLDDVLVCRQQHIELGHPEI